MTTIIRAGSSAEFLALVPHLAGYVPRQSVALVPFRGTHTVGLLRFDLPDANADAFAATAIGTVCRLAAVDGVAVVIYTDAAITAQALPHAALAECLRARADACGLRLGESLVMGSDGWASFLDGGRHRMDELNRTAPIAALPPLAPSQSAGVELPRVRAPERRAVRAAVRALEARASAAHTDTTAPNRGVAGDELDDPVLFWDAVLDADPRALDPARNALLLWSVRRPVLRDAALACWTRGPAYADGVLAFQLDWRPGDPPPTGPLFLAGEGPQPDPQRLLSALTLVKRLAALGEGGHRTAALGCAAWLSWALGLGTHAHAFAQRALRAQPTLGLAEIVLTLTDAGHLPAWAFERRRPTSPTGTGWSRGCPDR